MDPKHLEYRQHLVAAEKDAIDAYDKAVLSLSGGALGLSFAFIDKFIDPKAIQSPGLLIGAWVFWSLSIVFVLASYFTSHLALRNAINQIDQNMLPGAEPGGAFSKVTATLNVVSGLSFVAGVATLATFVYKNLGG